MQRNQISNDDLQDVSEMSDKMEAYFNTIMKDNQLDLAMGALMSTTINCMVEQSRSLQELIFYGETLLDAFDKTIAATKKKKPDHFD
jgi:hypothetical protein